MLVVVDGASGVEHRLEPLAAVIWRCSDGSTSAADLARHAQDELGQPVELDTVWAALDALADAGLLEVRVTPPAGNDGVSRRRFLRTAGAVGVALGAGVVGDVAPALATPASQEQQQKASQEQAQKQNQSQELQQKRSQEQEQKALHGEGPLGLLQGDLATLQGLQGTLGSTADLGLDAAIGALEVATSASNWIDDKHLEISRGVLVFAALTGAAFTLGLIANASSAINPVISDLVAAASYLANNAVSAATNVSTGVLTLATNRIATAGTDAAAGRYVAAVAAYGEAWAAVSL